MLGKRAFDQRGDVAFREPNSGESIGHFELLHQTDDLIRENVPCSLGRRVGDSRPHELRGAEVAIRTRGRGKAKHSGRGEHYGHAVRDDRVLCDHALGLEIAHHARDRIRHAVAQVNPGIPKANARERCGQTHLCAGLVILRVANRAGQVLRGHLNGFACPHVGDGIATLIRGPFERSLGHGPLGIGHGGERLQGVAQHIEASRRRDRRGHGARVFRIDDGEVRLEVPVGNAGFDVPIRQVHNRHPSGLASRAGCGGYGNEGFDRAGHGFALPDRRVDVREKIVGIGGEQIGGLGRVYRRPAANADIALVLAFNGDCYRVFERDICRLDAHPVKHVVFNALGLEGLSRNLHRGQVDEVGIRHHEHAPNAHIRQVHADLTRRPHPKAQV